MSIKESAAAFQALHEGPGIFVMPNPWDTGTARVLAGPGGQPARHVRDGCLCGARNGGGIARSTAEAGVAVSRRSHFGPVIAVHEPSVSGTSDNQVLSSGSYVPAPPAQPSSTGTPPARERNAHNMN